MGTSGTNRFSDYTGEKEPPTGKPAKGGGKTSTAGSSSGGNQCERAHGDISLEEVARCDYFKSHKGVPSVDTLIAVRKKLEGGRLAVETAEDSEVVGYLPTRYLYLRKCMQQGWTYVGHVLASSGGKSPIVRVDIAPDKRPKK